jgi:hypothetical protein
MKQKGQPKKIESPERLWELFVQYKEWVESNPIRVQDFVGKDGDEVYRLKERPLTMEGFECFVMDNTCIIYPDLTNYFECKAEGYKPYFPISSRIRQEIRNNQVQGGMVGIFNPSLTARINSITEKTESKNENNNIVSGELVVNIKSSNAKLANKESDIDTERHS